MCHIDGGNIWGVYCIAFHKIDTTSASNVVVSYCRTLGRPSLPTRNTHLKVGGDATAFPGMTTAIPRSATPSTMCTKRCRSYTRRDPVLRGWGFLMLTESSEAPCCQLINDYLRSSRQIHSCSTLWFIFAVPVTINVAVHVHNVPHDCVETGPRRVQLPEGDWRLEHWFLIAAKAATQF